MEAAIKLFFDNIFNFLRIPLKVLIVFLNCIHYPDVWEVHGLRGNTKTSRPDLRAIYVLIKGQRKLPLGFIIVAYLNGFIFDASVNTSGLIVKGIHTEDFDTIVLRWGL